MSSISIDLDENLDNETLDLGNILDNFCRYFPLKPSVQKIKIRRKCFSRLRRKLRELDGN